MSNTMTADLFSSSVGISRGFVKGRNKNRRMTKRGEPNALDLFCPLGVHTTYPDSPTALSGIGKK
jgi:hypothetical protein